jgi:hypothetical protein
VRVHVFVCGEVGALRANQRQNITMLSRCLLDGHSSGNCKTKVFSFSPVYLPLLPTVLLLTYLLTLTTSSPH